MKKKSLESTPGISVFHDSGCPVCRAEVGLMRKLDADKAITWVDIHAADDPLSAAGISYTEAMKNIHVRDAAGQLHKGVDGFMAMWEKLPGYRRLVPIINAVPGAKTLLNMLYALFSKIRMRVYRERVAMHDGTSAR